MSSSPNKPLLRWVGGKRWLVENYSDLFPENYGVYHEPFLGSGAVFFHLGPKKAFLSDKNKWLIDTYNAVQQNHEVVERYLLKFQERHSTENYYKVRKKVHKDLHKSAAQFIYLNRTCWNGLFRVNKKGEFNVPIGTRENIVREGEVKKVSETLSGATITNKCYRDSLKSVKPGDFVFVDPPYTAKHNNNGFLKYNKNLFSWEDQVALRDLLVAKKLEGAKILVLNANHESVKELYSDLGEPQILSRKSLLSASSSHRGETTEMAIRVGY